MNWRAFRLLFRLTLSGYTDGAVNTLSTALSIATSRGHHSLMPEHLLAGLATTDYGPSRTLLGRLGLNLHAEIEEVLELVDSATPIGSGRLNFGPQVRDLLSRARGLARGVGCPYVGTQHLVLALLMGPRCTAGDYLRGRGATQEAIRAAVASL